MKQSERDNILRLLGIVEPWNKMTNTLELLLDLNTWKFNTSLLLGIISYSIRIHYFVHLIIVFQIHRAFICRYLDFLSAHRNARNKHQERKTLNVAISFSNSFTAQVVAWCRVGRECFNSATLNHLLNAASSDLCVASGKSLILSKFFTYFLIIR